MGFLSKLFGGEEHPPLDPSDPAAARIAAQRGALEEMAHRVRDRLELVPAGDAVLVFIGKPPDRFGVAWFRDGEEHNFKKLLAQKGLAQRDLQALSEKLRVAYEKHLEEPRYALELAGRQLVVTPSPGLAADVGAVLASVRG